MKKRFALGLAAGLGAAMMAARLSRARLGISFEDRVVVITGGSRGLGLVLARLLVDEGARVVLLARDMTELERARVELQARGRGAVLTLRCDVRRRADVRAAVDEVIERWRSIDVLINNAGVIQSGPLDTMAREDFENAMGTHFWGPLHLILETAPVMRHRGFGRIVNIASIGGRVAVPHLAPYSASKFALIGLSDAVRAELDPHGIRVTTVVPGLIRTGSSIPGLTTSPERAAMKIVDACRYGDPALTLTAGAKIAGAANAVMPASVARAMMLVARLLPATIGVAGNTVKESLRLATNSGAPT